jgi:hypothetical protein
VDCFGGVKLNLEERELLRRGVPVLINVFLQPGIPAKKYDI